MVLLRSVLYSILNHTSPITIASFRTSRTVPPCLHRSGPTRKVRLKADMATMASLESVAGGDQEHGYHPPRPRRFAPLNPEKANSLAAKGLPRLRGVVFDVDGTLCLPQNYMFQEMRDVLGIPKSTDILDHIRSLSNQPDQDNSTNGSAKPHSVTHPSQQPSEQMLDRSVHDSAAEPTTSSSPQSRAVAAIQAIERRAMTSQRAQPGLVELMTYLNSRQILKGLCTRNFPAPVQHLIDAFLEPHGVRFSEQEIVTRDAEGIKPKPSPEGIWSIAKYWSLTRDIVSAETVQEMSDGAHEGDVLDVARKYLGSGLIMVGDSIDDMAAGYRAGAATVLLVNEHNKALAEHEFTDLAIKRLDELIEILEQGFVGNVSL